MKNGIVTFGTAEPEHAVKLNAPTFELVSVTFNVKQSQLSVVVRAADTLNDVSREYLMELPAQALGDFDNHLVQTHVIPALKAEFVEFQGMIKIESNG